MRKKIIAIGALLVMMFSLAACGDNYVYQKADFRLTIAVNKTNVVVGETVEITVKLENLSGKDILVQMPNALAEKTEDIVKIALVSEEAVSDKIRDGLGNFFYNEPVEGSRLKFEFKKNQIISRTEIFVIENATDCEVVAAALFRTSHNFDSVVGVHSHHDKRIKINIIQEGQI